jgi:hypothetical protein
MIKESPSALVTERGRRVLFRIRGRIYELSHEELRSLLGVPSRPPGLGIMIDRDHFRFEFADDHSIEISAGQLQRRLSKRDAQRQESLSPRTHLAR